MVACSSDVEVGANFRGPGSGGFAGLDSGALSDRAVLDSGPCVPVSCRSKPYKCGNCADDDGDGLIDSDDSECLGPCDDTEDSYDTGIPGNNAPCRQDCYFDTNSGNDGCYWSHRCDRLSLPDAYPPSGDSRCAHDPNASIPGTVQTCSELLAAQPAQCTAECVPLSPNGCDCFGCCELPARRGKYVWIGSAQNGAGSCNAASVNDPSLCRPCSPVTSCLNACDACEVCAGTTTPDASCGSDTDGGPNRQCPVGRAACGSTREPACPAGQYCITGCCGDVPA